MTRTLEWIKIKDILARWYVHDLGAPLEYVMNSCYISIVEQNQRHVCCRQDLLRYQALYLLIMPTERRRENKRTPREQKAHQYLTHVCNVPVHACVLINDMTCVLATTKQYRTAIHTLDRVDIFGEGYILAKIPKLHQSSLNICKHLAAHCQHMQCVDCHEHCKRKWYK